jgi:AraC-like DNA-binding protein
MNPEEVHTGYSANDLPLTYRMLYPSVNLIQQLGEEMQAYEFPYFKEAVVEDENLARIIYYLHVALEQTHDRLEKESLLIEVLSTSLARYTDIKIRPVHPCKQQRVVRLIKEYLHDNFRSNISLEQLVELTNLNRFYLIRVFRKAVGMPPLTYLNQIRVEKAKQFLAQGNSVVDVAYFCWYVRPKSPHSSLQANYGNHTRSLPQYVNIVQDKSVLVLGYFRSWFLKQD